MTNIDRATAEEFESAPATVELFCRTGFENIKGKDNEPGKNDYVHVKLDRRFVCYKVTGCHRNEDGEVSISCRKVKGKDTDTKPKLSREEQAEVEAIEREIAQLIDDQNVADWESTKELIQDRIDVLTERRDEILNRS